MDVNFLARLPMSVPNSRDERDSRRTDTTTALRRAAPFVSLPLEVRWHIVFYFNGASQWARPQTSSGVPSEDGGFEVSRGQ